MKAVVCVAENGAMLFGGRRVSRDKIMLEDFLRLASDGAIFISDFSMKLFDGADASLIVASNPLSSADVGDFAFVEDKSLYEYRDKIEELIIYKWNRSYPGDFFLDIDPEKEKMTLKEVYEFEGKSHEKITRECWER